MDDAVPPEKRRLILSFAPPDAYVPHVRTILGRMGYAIVSREEWEASAALAARAPELAILDERHLAEPAGPAFAALPAILISSRGVLPVGQHRFMGPRSARPGSTRSTACCSRRSNPRRGAASASPPCWPCVSGTRGASSRVRCSRSPRTAAWCARPS
jgi:hypothetical protein